MTRTPCPLTTAQLGDVSRASYTSTRTVRRYLAGLPVSDSTYKRVTAALHARRLGGHVRAFLALPAEA